MTPRLKICCIANVDEARAAAAAGAHALGLVSAMPSGPGVISDALVAQIAQAMQGTSLRTFLLTARTDARSIAQQHAAAGTTTLQLVDHVPLADLRALRQLCPGVELVQVIHVSDERAIEQALAVAPLVDAVLLDSGRPDAAIKELGGTGRTHDWRLSRRIRDALAALTPAVPLWLAGGLRPDNVAQAIAEVQPHGLDVCSGVRSDGQLDGHKLQALVAAIRVTPH
jgi:phosphoribosylanthranilate isomerase